MANRDRSIEPKKGWFKAVFLVVLWLLILSMWRDYGRIRGGYARKVEAERRLAEAKAHNDLLRRELGAVSSLEYKEKVIREKLNMQKGGEVIVVLPDVESEKEYRINAMVEEKRENWRKWLDLVAD